MYRESTTTVNESITAKLDRIEENQKEILSLYSAMAEQVNDMHDIMFSKKKNNVRILNVFREFFGNDDIYKFKNFTVIIESNHKGFDMYEINNKLKRIGFSATLVEMSPIISRMHPFKYVFKVHRGIKW